MILKRRNLIPRFGAFGHNITGPDGAYQFRTIKPVTYLRRTLDIHVKVSNGTDQPFTKQSHIECRPANPRVRIFGRLSAAGAAAVSMVFETVKSIDQTAVYITIYRRTPAKLAGAPSA